MPERGLREWAYTETVTTILPSCSFDSRVTVRFHDLVERKRLGDDRL